MEVGCPGVRVGLGSTAGVGIGELVVGVADGCGVGVGVGNDEVGERDRVGDGVGDGVGVGNGVGEGIGVEVIVGVRELCGFWSGAASGLVSCRGVVLDNTNQVFARCLVVQLLEDSSMS